MMRTYLLTILSLILLLAGCNSGPSDPLTKTLILSGHPLDRKIGQVVKKIAPFEPSAILTFAQKGLKGNESKGLIIQVRENNIYFSRIFEKDQLYTATNFTFFPDTLIRVAVREFADISKESTRKCEQAPSEDYLLGATFLMDGKFQSMEMGMQEEIACNQDSRKAQFLVALARKFEILPNQ